MEITGLSPEEIAVRASRRALAHAYLRGRGIEVGAGDRPVPLPHGVQCFYGDVRDSEALETYFGAGSGAKSPLPTFLDAQTLAGVADGSVDFVISAHVIEHLPDALGAFRNAVRVLKPGGIFMLIVPDMRYTFDHLRPITPLAHLIADAEDGGRSTLLEAYREHGRYILPTFGSTMSEEEIERRAQAMHAERADTHFHTWDTGSLFELIHHESRHLPIRLLTMVPVENENIAVIRRRRPLWRRIVSTR